MTMMYEDTALVRALRLYHFMASSMVV